MEALAATAISLVAPYLVKGAEGFASEAGKQIGDKVGELAKRLGKWWSGEPVAAAAAKEIPNDPVKYGKLLETLLSGDLAKDEALASEVRTLVDQLGPQVQVIQRMEVAKGVTGADISVLASGRVNVEQDIKDATGVTGVKAGRVG